MYGRRHTESNKALMSKCHEKSVMVEFPNGKKMSFESRNKCIEYFQKNYGVGIYVHIIVQNVLIKISKAFSMVSFGLKKWKNNFFLM